MIAILMNHEPWDMKQYSCKTYILNNINMFNTIIKKCTAKHW